MAGLSEREKPGFTAAPGQVLCGAPRQLFSGGCVRGGHPSLHLTGEVSDWFRWPGGPGGPGGPEAPGGVESGCLTVWKPLAVTQVPERGAPPGSLTAASSRP